MLSPLHVTLTWYEALAAANVGVARQADALRRGAPERFGRQAGRLSAWETHINGACGEMAFSKAMSVHWDFSIGVSNRPDFPSTEVKTRTKDDYDLIVRRRPNDEHLWMAYVLITGEVPAYKVWGWTLGYLCSKDRFLQSYGGRDQAYFVEKECLYPMERWPGFERIEIELGKRRANL